MRKVWKLNIIFEFISDYIKKRSDSDDEYILTIKKKKKTRTLPENKLFHVLFQLFVDEEKKLWNEYTLDEMKNIMKMALIWVREVRLWEFIIQYPLKWTSELTVKEWCDFIDKMIYSLNERYWLNIESKDDQRLIEYFSKNIQ